jgi:hypothetical protein
MGEISLCDGMLDGPLCTNMSDEHPPYIPLNQNHQTIFSDPDIWSVYLYSRAPGDLMWGSRALLMRDQHVDRLELYRAP